MSKRILFIDEARAFGGSVIAMARSAKALKDRGMEVHAVLTSNDERSLAALNGSGAEVHVLPLKRRSQHMSDILETLHRRFRPAKYLLLIGLVLVEAVHRLQWMVQWYRLITCIDPGIVHANNGPAFNAAAMLVASFHGLPVVVTVRGGHRVGFWGRRAQKRADAELFISRYMRQTCPPLCPRSAVVYDGLEMGDFPPPSQAPAVPPVKFVHVGMFLPWKGQELFLQAAQRVAARHPQAEFYLCGDIADNGQREYAQMLHALADRAPLGGKAHFLGFQSRIQPILNDMHVLVHCSTEPEPFGLVLLEGMACGRGVIAPAEGGPVEIVRDGIDGILVPPRQVDALAGAMERLLGEPGKIDAMGRSARQRVTEAFTMDQTASRLMEAYAAIHD